MVHDPARKDEPKQQSKTITTKRITKCAEAQLHQRQLSACLGIDPAEMAIVFGLFGAL